MPRVLRRAVGAVILCYGGLAMADDVLPPPQGLTDDAPILRAKPNAGSDVVSSVQLGPLTVLLEETTLSDVKELLGVGRIDRLPGDETGPAWICYTLDSGPQAQRVWLSTRPGQNGFAVFEVAAMILGRGEGASAACPKLAVDPARVSLDDGIWVGRTTADVQRIIGAGAKYSGFHMLFEHVRPVSNGQLVDTRLVLEFSEGRVIGLWARKTTRH